MSAVTAVLLFSGFQKSQEPRKEADKDKPLHDLLGKLNLYVKILEDVEVLAERMGFLQPGDFGKGVVEESGKRLGEATTLPNAANFVAYLVPLLDQFFRRDCQTLVKRLRSIHHLEERLNLQPDQ